MKNLLMLAMVVATLPFCGCGSMNGFPAHRGEYPRNSVVIWNESHSELTFRKNGQPWPAKDVEYRQYRYAEGVIPSPTIILKNCSSLDHEEIMVTVTGAQLIRDGFSVKTGLPMSRNHFIKMGTTVLAQEITVRDKDFK